MVVMMLRHTSEPDLLCGQAAAMCTGFSGAPEKALRGALKDGHESVAEHASFTFVIEGVSRVLLAQLTRHRLASFSVQSQRYCGADMEMVVPESMVRAELVDDIVEVNRAVKRLHNRCKQMGIPDEDSRFYTLQGGVTRLMMTANARELRHFFSLRCCNRAQWEIRELANEMLRQCREVAPVLFDNAGPGCVRGKCPEGSRGCGRGDSQGDA